MFKYLQTLYLIVCLMIGSSVNAQTSIQQQQLKHKEDSLILSLNNSKHDTAKMGCLLNLITLYQDVQPKKITDWIQQGIAIAIKNKNYDKLLSFYVADIRYNTRQRQFNEALAIAAKGEELLIKPIEPRTAAAFYMEKGTMYYKMSAFEKAAIEYNNVVLIGKKNSLPEVEVKAIMNLALLYDILERYDDMRNQLLEAVAIANKNKLEEDKANLQFNLAYLESKVNNYGKAIDYLLEVLPYYENKGNKVVIATGYANLGWGYYQIKNYVKALEYSKKSFELRQQMNDLPGTAKLHINLGQVYLEMGNTDSALTHLNEGIILSKKLSIPANLKDGYKALASLQQRKNQYKEALESMQLYIQWRDTVYQQDKQKQLLRQLNVYKYQYADSTATQSIVTIKKKESIIKWLGISFTISIIGIIGLLLIFFRFKKRSKPTIASTNMQQQHLSEFEEGNLNNMFAEKEKLQHEILGLKSEIRKLESGLKNQTREDLESLRKLVGESKLQTEGYWNEFLLLFSKVYPNFLEQLKTQFPQLSQNELRICALMKLNLSLVEIASLLNIATESVRKARYRMYKKMDLESDQELADKIITF